ncbi:hypothetical protein RRG08_043548 [Elysia crispata]|uniref:Uncharacterized protein n=1 Tax=Elysia crispata TaxID=231223 RepID=A0AAE0YH63_9GAST|nr:hypothetical protein RRG08_043548 [Elysia crispata]
MVFSNYLLHFEIGSSGHTILSNLQERSPDFEPFIQYWRSPRLTIGQFRPIARGYRDDGAITSSTARNSNLATSPSHSRPRHQTRLVYSPAPPNFFPNIKSRTTASQ